MQRKVSVQEHGGAAGQHEHFLVGTLFFCREETLRFLSPAFSHYYPTRARNMKAVTGLVLLALASTAVGEDPEERKRARAEVRKKYW